MSKGTVKQLGHVIEFTVLKFGENKRQKKSRSEWSTNEERLDNNIARAKRKVKEIALCNPWEWFGTLTISPDKYNRQDLERFYADFSEFIHNRESRPKYIVLPEFHADGVSIHLHGLFHSIPFREMEVIEGRLNWKPYYDKFGFSKFEPIRDPARASFYMLKYVTKEAGQAVARGKQIFRASKGLARAETIGLYDDIVSPEDYAAFVRDFERLDTKEFETDYIRRKTISQP